MDLRVDKLMVWVFKGSFPSRGIPLVGKLFSLGDDKLVSLSSSCKAKFLEGDLYFAII